MWKRLPTSERLVRRGKQISPVCLSCIVGAEETENHIFLQCEHAQNLWQWALTLLKVDLMRFDGVGQLLERAAKLQGRKKLKTRLLYQWCCVDCGNCGEIETPLFFTMLKLKNSSV